MLEHLNNRWVFSADLQLHELNNADYGQRVPWTAMVGGDRVREGCPNEGAFRVPFKVRYRLIIPQTQRRSQWRRNQP